MHGSGDRMTRRLRTTAVAAIAVIPWLPAVAPGGNVASGGKAGSTTAMATKGSSMRPHRGLSVVRGFGGFCCFGSTHFDDASFLIVDATPAEAQVFLDGRFLGTAADLLARALPLAPGRHIAQVIAPGFAPYVIRFAAEPSFSTRLRTALSCPGQEVHSACRD